LVVITGPAEDIIEHLVLSILIGVSSVNNQPWDVLVISGGGQSGGVFKGISLISILAGGHIIRAESILSGACGQSSGETLSLDIGDLFDTDNSLETGLLISGVLEDTVLHNVSLALLFTVLARESPLASNLGLVGITERNESDVGHFEQSLLQCGAEGGGDDVTATGAKGFEVKFDLELVGGKGGGDEEGEENGEFHFVFFVFHVF